MATLTIFANFRISDEERFLRMKDSFQSFKDIAATKWVINARGKFKEETLAFLYDNLGDKLIPYRLESKQGWFADSKQLLKDLDTDFVFFWLEDHINLAPVEIYQEIIDEMKANNSDYLGYSWWYFGKPLEIYKDIEKKETKNLYTFTLDRDSLRVVRKKYSPFIISMVGLFSADLFKKIINETGTFWRQFSKFCPFSFEKGAEETRWLPVRSAIPKRELFAAIDDGHGYCLQDRGLYPIRKLRNAPIAPIPGWKSIFRSRFKKLIPNFLYKKLIRVVIFTNRLRKYLKLVTSGQ